MTDPSLGSIAGARALVDARLGLLVPPSTQSDPLREAMRHALLAPGKRIRPLIVMLAGAELGLEVERVLDVACAVEMVHAASLVLDDLPSMDDSETRRGRPATHVAFGEDVAILAAIGLLGRAFSVAATTPALPAARRGLVVATLADAIGPDGLSAGQLADLKDGGRGPAVDRVLDTNHLKTGVLFIACIDIACIAAGADEDTRLRLQRSATHIGQAFQLLDDLVDGAPAAGAPDGSVEDLGKVTLLSLLGEAEVGQRIEDHLHGALGGLRPSGSLATYVRHLFPPARSFADGRKPATV